MVRHEPRRVLADVAAKRRLLARHAHPAPRWVGLPRADREERYCMGCDEVFPCETVRLLALPYSQHPGYREDWRPL